MKILITHAAYLWEREQSLLRLIQGLDTNNFRVLKSEYKEHANVWAIRLWEYVANLSNDPVICLNDDVTVCDNFTKECEKIIKEIPRDVIISLHLNVPEAKDYAEKYKFLRCYQVSGPA